MSENVLSSMESTDSLQKEPLPKAKSGLGQQLGHRSPLKDILNTSPPQSRIIKVGHTLSRFELLRQLDEEAEWRERTEVVTSLDHRLNMDMARDLLDQTLVAATKRAHTRTAIGPVEFREAKNITLVDSESEYESAEEDEGERTLAPLMRGTLASSSSPTSPMTLVSSTLIDPASAISSPNRSESFENSLLNSFENMKIVEKDDEKFHDASDDFTNHQEGSCEESGPAKSPSKENTQAMNSPSKENVKHVNSPSKENVKLVNSPSKETVKLVNSPSKQNVKLVNSPSKENVKLVNSPSKENVKLVNSPSKENVKLVNSPSKENVKLVNSPSKENVKLVNSPSKENVKFVNSPSKENVKLVNSPSKENVKLVNSPSKENVKLVNSPSKENVKLVNSQSKENVKSMNSPSKENVKPMNSPSKENVKPMNSPSKENVKSMNSPSKESAHFIISPSKESVQLANSPSRECVHPTSSSSKGNVQLANSPNKESVQLGNSCKDHTKLNKSAESFTPHMRSEKLDCIALPEQEKEVAPSSCIEEAQGRLADRVEDIDVKVCETSNPMPSLVGKTSATVLLPLKCSPPKKGYADVLDVVDDINFNPFVTKSNVANSPDRVDYPQRMVVDEVVVTENMTQAFGAEDEMLDCNVSPAVGHSDNMKGRVSTSIRQCQGDTDSDASALTDGDMICSEKLECNHGSSCGSPNSKNLTRDTGTVQDQHRHKKQHVVAGTVSTESTEDSVPVSSKSYDLKCLDDPCFNPFATKSCVVNSPEKQGGTSTANEMKDMPLDSTETPCLGPSQRVEEEISEYMNINVATSKESAPQSLPKVLDNDEQDSLENTVVACSPDASNSSQTNSPSHKHLNFKSLSDDPNFDPFKTTASVVNSPDRQTDSPSSKHLNLENLADDPSFDPFKTKANVANSLDRQIDSPLSKHLNFKSPADDPGFDPFKTKATVVNSPGRQTDSPSNHLNLENLSDDPNFDPFKTKATVVNSPDRQTVSPSCKHLNFGSPADDPNFDPFKIKAIVANSPDRQTLSPSSKHLNLENLADDPNFDPFKTMATVVNSPDRQTHSPSSKHLTFASSADDPSFDPFKTKANFVNSPDKQTVSPSCKHLNLENLSNDPSSDPVKTKASVVNSPDKQTVSPSKHLNLENLADDPNFDPFKTKATVVNSPDRQTDSPSSKHLNFKSPADDPSFDPFKTKASVTKSPDRQTSTQSTGPESGKNTAEEVVRPQKQESQDVEKLDHLSDVVSKEKGKKEMAFAGESLPGSLPQERLRETSSKSASPKEAERKSLTSEEEFTSAADFFNNPAVLDALETHGVQGDKHNLVRNSLYVKFDPLVSGRHSLAPFLAQQLLRKDQDDDCVRRSSGLISFSPSPKKKQRWEQQQEHKVPVESFFSTMDTSITLDTTATTTLDITALEAANETVIHNSAAAVMGKMVTEAEMNNRIKSVELMMQDEILRKGRIFEEEKKELNKKIEEQNIALLANEEEITSLKNTIQQMTSLASKMKHAYDVSEKQHKENLQQQEAEWEKKLSLASESQRQSLEELNKTEASFFQLVRKFERVREVCESLQQQKEKLMEELERVKKEKSECVEKYKTAIMNLQESYEKVQEEQKLAKQNHEQEMKRASVLIKHAELKILSLTQTEAMKNTEIKRLTSLLEDMTGNMNEKA